jgi:hypothetical protein
LVLSSPQSSLSAASASLIIEYDVEQADIPRRLQLAFEQLTAEGVAALTSSAEFALPVEHLDEQGPVWSRLALPTLAFGLKGNSRLDQVDTIVFDKTGTLTTGVLEVGGIVAFKPRLLPRRRLLALAAAAESRLRHPVADAVLRRAAASLVVYGVL